jgi:hypothetical protein
MTLRPFSWPRRGAGRLVLTSSRWRAVSRSRAAGGNGGIGPRGAAHAQRRPALRHRGPRRRGL